VGSTTTGDIFRIWQQGQNTYTSFDVVADSDATTPRSLITFREDANPATHLGTQKAVIGWYNPWNAFTIGGSSSANGYFNVITQGANAGNVGIGTTAPAEKLEVVGNIAVSGTVDGIDIATDVAANTAKETNVVQTTITGNAGTATTLATPRAIFGQNFDGSAAVTGNATLGGIVMDGNTITGIDDSSEFTNNDNHIMTSAAIEDKILSYGYTAYAGPEEAEEGTKGIVEIATEQEAIDGEENVVKAVTPFGVLASFAARKVHQLAAPTAALAMNSQKVTGVANPTAAQDAATKAYTDAKTWNWNDITAGTAPTFNQNTTGSAATLTTPRAINGVDFNGSAAITIPTRACFEFKGYGTADGTNYEMGELMTVSTAPFNHDTSTGYNGLTAQTIQTIMRSGGTVMPYAGTLKKFTGWVTSAANNPAQTVDVGIFKVTPTDDAAGDLTPFLLVNAQTTASGNNITNSFSETPFSIAFSAGDIIYSAVKGGTDDKAWYFYKYIRGSMDLKTAGDGRQDIWWNSNNSGNIITNIKIWQQLFNQ
jgi:hypothetical protein